MNSITMLVERQIGKLTRGYQFVNDVLYYWQRGHQFKDAVNMAHRVVTK